MPIGQVLTVSIHPWRRGGNRESCEGIEAADKAQWNEKRPLQAESIRGMHTRQAD